MKYIYLIRKWLKDNSGYVITMITVVIPLITVCIYSQPDGRDTLIVSKTISPAYNDYHSILSESHPEEYFLQVRYRAIGTTLTRSIRVTHEDFLQCVIGTSCHVVSTDGMIAKINLGN